MASNNPDLVSVLRTLAGFTSQKQPVSTDQPDLLVAHLHHPPPQQTWLPHKTFQGTQSQLSFSSPKPVDPATITEWSAGLRCVMKTVAKHENMLQDIRHMMKIQQEHEIQWWKSREALIERQKARKEGQKKLDDVLKLVGGTVSGSSNTSSEEMARELETFDMKVYRAEIDMGKVILILTTILQYRSWEPGSCMKSRSKDRDVVTTPELLPGLPALVELLLNYNVNYLVVREMTAKLRSLGVPFFGTKTELIRINGAESAAGSAFQIDEAELVKLQKKMLAILEDLCTD